MMGGRAGLILSVTLILILASINIYTYVLFSRENLELRNRLLKNEDDYHNLAQSYDALRKTHQKLREDYDRLVEENKNLSLTLSEMEFNYNRLYSSYMDVLEANRNLTRALEIIANKLVVPSNYTLMGYYDFEDRFIFAYNEEMKQYVYSITNGWDGSWEDFLSDLYKICERWGNDFTYEFPSPAWENLTFIMVGTWWNPETLMGDRYLKEVRNVDVMNMPVIGAQISFRYKRGVCWDYTTVLVSLYYAYYDMVGKALPTGYLSIELKDRGVHHGCVVIKEKDDRIAIIDWDPITMEDGKITFLPFKEAKMLHERYWNSSISYDGVQWRTYSDPFVVNNFSSEEEFYEWLTEEFN